MKISPKKTSLELDVKMGLKKSIKSLLTLSLVLSVMTLQSVRAQIIDSAKLPSIELKTFNSKILGGARSLYIHVPGRMKADEKYPVLYLLDGESFIQMASGQVQYLSESYKIIPSMIIVGIKSNDRFKDLTPTHTIVGNDGKPDSSANNPFKNSGGADKFLQFLKQELFPYVESHYPAAPYRILFGHSLGGLMAVHTLMTQPDLFNAYIAASPSFQWDQEKLLKSTSDRLGFGQSNKILFFSDANEDAKFRQYQVQFDSVIKQKTVPGFNSKYIQYADESHISEPVKAFYDGIRHIYPSWHLPINSSAFRKTLTTALVISHYSKLSDKYHYQVLPPQDEINQISKFMANDPGKTRDALELLNFNLKNYPKSAVIYEIMGDTYIKMKDTANALIAFRKGQELDPASKSIPQKLSAIH